MTQTVALLGAGTMGSGMGANLLKAGFQLTIYNRTAGRAQRLVDAGARLAGSPAEASRGAQIVLSMLADDPASREVWLGPQGALEATSPSAVLIESSTVSPAWIAELSRTAEARGNRLLDAPVTGSRAAAQAAQLTFLVGGETEALEEARPVLQAMSKAIVHLGPTGSGAKLKLVNNFLSAVQVVSFAEALAWLERSGLDVGKCVDFLKSAAPGSPVINAVAPRMTTGKHELHFYLKLMAKDLQYASAEAIASGTELRTGSSALSRFEDAIHEGFGDEDMATVVEPLRRTR